MLTNGKTLKGYSIQNLSGETIGKVREFYFDDHDWTIRYLIADTGTWLADRLVLVSPYALVRVNADPQTLVVNLTKQQIENSPALDRDLPVSRQFEASHHGYYGWPADWGGHDNWGSSPPPSSATVTNGAS